MRIKRNENHPAAVWKMERFLLCKKNKVSLYPSTKKTVLEKILRVQILLYPT